MIKINLLPHKKIMPVEKGLQKINAVVVVVTILIVAGLILWFYLLTSKISALKDKNDEATKQLDALKTKIKDVEGYEKSRTDYEEKLKVIQELQKQKVPMSSVLGEINRSLARSVWLTSLSVTDGIVILDGMAKDDKKYIDDFEAGIKNSPLFTDIALSDVKDSTAGGPLVKTYTFKVTAKIAGYVQKPKEAVGKAKDAGDKAKGGAKKPATK